MRAAPFVLALLSIVSLAATVEVGGIFGVAVYVFAVPIPFFDLGARVLQGNARARQLVGG